MNLIAILVAALVPLLIGFVWYNPKAFGTAWMKASDMTEEKMKGSNMVKIFGLTYLLSFFIAAMLNPIVIHQMHLDSLLLNEPGFADPNSELSVWLADFLSKYGNNFRTFQHGAFHGVFAGIMFALPIIGINALFERKSFKYVMINTGYWILCLAIMGGIVSVWQ